MNNGAPLALSAMVALAIPETKTAADNGDTQTQVFIRIPFQLDRWKVKQYLYLFVYQANSRG